MNRPHTTVILTIKDGAKTAPRAIQSILDQTFRDLELVIVNDGSTDQTQEVIESFAAQAPRVRVVMSPVNVGLARARNLGLDAARGEWLYFIDADDFLAPDGLEALHRVATEDDVELVVGGMRSLDPATGAVGPRESRAVLLPREIRKTTLGEYPRLVKNTSILNCLFAAGLFARHGIRFSETRRYADDVPVSFYAAFHARSISLMPRLDGYLYTLGNFLGTSSPAKMRDWRDSSAEILRFARANGSAPVRRAMFLRIATIRTPLVRAERAFGRGAELREFIGSLSVLFDGFPAGLLPKLALFDGRFTAAMRESRHDDAYREFLRMRKWEDQHAQKPGDYGPPSSSRT